MFDNFDIEKNGYNKKQVEKYIEDLKVEYTKQIENLTFQVQDLKESTSALNEQLNGYKKRDSQISGALVAAVETAQNIEKSSKNIYELEIQKVKLLYKKWESFLNDLLEKYPLLQDKFDEKRILKVFNDSIERTLKENFNSINNDEGGKSTLQNLIKKMSNARTVNKQVENYNYAEPKILTRNKKPKEKTLKNFKKEVNHIEEKKRLGEFKVQIKPISPLKNAEAEGYDSLADKFLNDDEVIANASAYEKAIVKSKKQKSGFDLQEALNPTENLEEIMKAFDFYEQDN